jgi:hypothetical protein
MASQNRSSRLQHRDLNLQVDQRSFPMISFRTLAVAAAMATFCVTGYAQTPVEHDTHHPDAAPTGNMPMPIDGPDAQMARLDEQMKAMQAMHDKMMMAKTPEERSALMAEHMKVMQDSMALMGEIGPGGMMGKGGMRAAGANTAGIPDIQDKDPTDGDMGVQRQMMEKRMQMMQSMIQMMLDRMPPAPGKP